MSTPPSRLEWPLIPLLRYATSCAKVPNVSNTNVTNWSWNCELYAWANSVSMVPSWLYDTPVLYANPIRLNIRQPRNATHTR
jgi:hypothetical protein